MSEEGTKFQVFRAATAPTLEQTDVLRYEGITPDIRDGLRGLGGQAAPRSTRSRCPDSQPRPENRNCARNVSRLDRRTTSPRFASRDRDSGRDRRLRFPIAAHVPHQVAGPPGARSPSFSARRESCSSPPATGSTWLHDACTFSGRRRIPTSCSCGKSVAR